MSLMPYQRRLQGLFKRLLSRRLEPRDGIKPTARWKPMPKRLREYYQVAGRLHSINRCYERLYRPDKLDDEGEYRIFMEENQNVAAWAFRIEDAGQENPTIYVGWVEENCKVGKWYPYKMPLAEWLVATVYWQVVNGGFRFGGYTESRKDLRRRLAARWPHVLTNPEDRAIFYGRNGQLLCWCGNRGKRGGSLYAAGRTKEDFRKIDKALKVDWSYSVLDDD